MYSTHITINLLAIMLPDVLQYFFMILPKEVQEYEQEVLLQNGEEHRSKHHGRVSAYMAESPPTGSYPRR